MECSIIEYVELTPKVSDSESQNMLGYKSKFCTKNPISVYILANL